MTVDFMRMIDKYVGIPACLVLSAIHTIISPLARLRRERPIKKILFIQISEMGSAISAYSALIKAKKLFPDAEIYYFIFREMQDAVHLLDVLPRDHVFTVTSKSAVGLLAGLFGMIIKMRRLKIDATLDLELFSRLSSILSYCFGARIRVAFNKFHMEGLYRGNHQTHPVLYNHMAHISHNFLSLVHALNQDPHDAPLAKIKIDDRDIVLPRVTSTTAQKQNILKKLKEINPAIDGKKTIIILNPNASELLPLRRWPLENYIAVAKRLLGHRGVFLIITGVPSEIREAQSICDAVNDPRCINFAGKTTLRELIDLYQIADIMLSNDSGPPNFASLTEMKALVFFGPETPQCYKPLGPGIQAITSGFACSPCVSAYNHRKSACTNNRCLQSIAPEEVYQRMKSILKLK